MARSLKKGPYVDEKLLKKVQGMNDGGKKKVIKTWSRRSMITPDFVGHTFAIHNGNKFIPVFISENMLDISWVNLPRLEFLECTPEIVNSHGSSSLQQIR